MEGTQRGTILRFVRAALRLVVDVMALDTARRTSRCRAAVAVAYGDAVVALIDNEATIKEFYVSGEAIVLRPRSRNSQHKPIILTRDFQIQGIVVTSIANL